MARNEDENTHRLARPLNTHSLMRYLRLILLLAGCAAVVFLVIRIGVGPLVSAFEALAWWQLLLVCLPYGLITIVDTVGWRFAFSRDRVPFLSLLGARTAGEALNLVTAVASVGGEAVKAWLIRRNVSYEESVPSVVIAKTTITIAQALFLLVGMGIGWLALPMDSLVVRSMLWLLVVEILAVAGFLLAQVTGLVRRGGRLLAWFGVAHDATYAEGLDRALRTYYRRHWRRFLLSTGFHLVGWLLGGLEAYLMLVVLGIPVSLGTALVIEAFGSAVRFATFLVPASVGAMEAANVAAFEGLGLTASAGLAFSLVRRGRQVVWIVIGLIVLVAMRSGFWLSSSEKASTAR